MTNNKNEKLYLVIHSKSKEIRPYISSARTWEEAIEIFNSFIEDMDNKTMFRKSVIKDIKENRAQCTCIENHKGFGPDYMTFTEIAPLYVIQK